MEDLKTVLMALFGVSVKRSGLPLQDSRPGSRQGDDFGAVSQVSKIGHRAEDNRLLLSQKETMKLQRKYRVLKSSRMNSRQQRSPR